MYYAGCTCSAILPAFFLLQLYPEEEAAQFSELSCGQGVSAGNGGHGGLSHTALLPAMLGH